MRAVFVVFVLLLVVSKCVNNYRDSNRRSKWWDED